MSLQVWLPLNGNLNNQGLGNISFSATTAIWDTSGKIGQALSTLNSNIIGNCPTLNGISTFSLAFWCFPKTNSSISANWCNIIALGSKSADNSTSAEFRFESSYVNNYVLSHHNNTGEPIGGGTGTLVSDRDKWYHIVVVANNEAHTIRYYVNGIQLTASGFLKTHNGGHLDGTIRLANENTDPDCLINDIRIYDHALSDKEIEEIAKGLVLHYKLNNEEYTNENLFSLENIYVNNSTVTKVITGDTIELTSRAVNYGGFSANTYMDFEAGVTYILSGHIKVIQKGTDNCVPRLCIRNNSHNIQVSQSVIDNESDVVMTLTPTSTFKGYVSGINTWSSGSNNTTNAITEFSKIKLEISSIKTPYIPNSNDGLYAALGYNKNIIYDSSGYGNNGTKNGTCNALTNSPKYNIALSGTGTITTTILALASLLATGKQYTLACWARPTGTNANGWVIKLGGTQCGLWWAKSEARWVWNENDNGKRCANPTISADYTNWHHLVTTVDKTTATAFIAKHYVDGLPATGYTQQTWDNGSNASPTGTDIVMTLTNADLSDVRLYSTCLTDNQIKELYNTSITIDNKNNVYARELVEQ